MAVSSNYCCLNMSCPPSTTPSTSSASPSQKSHTTHLSLPKKERSWRRQCLLGMACMIISIDSGGIIGAENRAIAGDMQRVVVRSEKKIVQWSDKRTCAPWRLNSLETIVPENLPRPSARRRWEEVDFSKLNAPTVQISHQKSANKCFSM